METETHKKSGMEMGVKELLTDGKAVWIPDEKIDMSVFTHYPQGRIGIAVYYPVYRDGSCAEAEYIHFWRSPKGMSIDLTTKTAYEMQEKERLEDLLRR